MKRETLNPKSEIRKDLTIEQLSKEAINKSDKEMVGKVEKLAEETTKLLEKYDFNHASQKLYDFVWHEFADIYIEDVKKRIDENSYLILATSYLILLRLLHPFMPFITEEIYQKFDPDKNLIVERWPSFAEASEGQARL